MSITSKIGYLVPEFPGQTHAFFWRETRALQDLGVEAQFISTRKPLAHMVVHDWADDAQRRTHYLAPFTLRDVVDVLSEFFLRSGLMNTLRCLKLVFTADDCSLVERLRLIALIIVAAKMVRVLRELDVDHLHVQSCGDSANLAMFASILSGLPYSLSLLGPTLELYGPNQKAKWRHATFGVVMSELLYGVVKTRLAGHLPTEVEIVPVGVDLAEMQRAQPYMPCRAGETCWIYSCGRLNAIKGHNHLIDAVALLRDRGWDCRLKIAGEDEQGGSGYRKTLESHIRERKMDEHVTLLGAVCETEHRAQLAQAHIFALASENEGISVAIMEAMAMQTPVVVTSVGGNGELITNGENGVFVRYGDSEEMADAIATVLENPDLAMQLSQASRKTVDEKFNAKSTAARLLLCLEQSQAASAGPT